jgi:hypothetical protein
MLVPVLSPGFSVATEYALLSARCAQALSREAAEATFRWAAWAVALRRQDGHCEGSPLVEGPGVDRGRPIESRASARRKAAEPARVGFC